MELPNRDQIKGMGKQISGEIKDKAGKLAGDNSTRVSGKLDKIEGKAQEAIGDLRERLERPHGRDDVV